MKGPYSTIPFTSLGGGRDRLKDKRLVHKLEGEKEMLNWERDDYTF
ncbi:hypothetical protein [Fervidicoccus sp.]